MPSVHFETFGLNAQLLSPPEPMRDFHHHSEVEINYVFSGGVTYLHRGFYRTIPTRQLVVFWGSVPHTLVEVKPGTEMGWITLPLAWVLEWNLPQSFRRGLLNGGLWMGKKDAGQEPRYPVHAWLEELSQAGQSWHKALLLELEACFLRLAETGSPTFDAAERPASTGNLQLKGLLHVEKMARFMAEHFHEELRVKSVAAEVGLHPVYAMNVFRDGCGVTIGDYLRSHRLTHAQKLLITTDLKIIDIALESGFRCLSSFYEAFHQVFHQTPKAFRIRMRRMGAPRREAGLSFPEKKRLKPVVGISRLASLRR